MTTLQEVKTVTTTQQPQELTMATTSNTTSNTVTFTGKPEHVANLRKLAKFLAALPSEYKQFDMSYYLYNDKTCTQIMPEHATIEVFNSCDTVACALGHGIAAGIGKLQSDFLAALPFTWRNQNSWQAYARDYFGLSFDVNRLDNNSDWDWCFSDQWTCEDNTPHGAAKRILYMLKYGTPENWDYDYATVCKYNNADLSEDLLTQATKEQDIL